MTITTGEPQTKCPCCQRPYERTRADSATGAAVSLNEYLTLVFNSVGGTMTDLPNKGAKTVKKEPKKTRYLQVSLTGRPDYLVTNETDDRLIQRTIGYLLQRGESGDSMVATVVELTDAEYRGILESRGGLRGLASEWFQRAGRNDD